MEIFIMKMYIDNRFILIIKLLTNLMKIFKASPEDNHIDNQK